MVRNLQLPLHIWLGATSCSTESERWRVVTKRPTNCHLVIDQSQRRKEKLFRTYFLLFPLFYLHHPLTFLYSFIGLLTDRKSMARRFSVAMPTVAYVCAAVATLASVLQHKHPLLHSAREVNPPHDSTFPPSSSLLRFGK